MAAVATSCRRQSMCSDPGLDILRSGRVGIGTTDPRQRRSRTLCCPLPMRLLTRQVLPSGPRCSTFPPFYQFRKVTSA